MDASTVSMSIEAKFLKLSAISSGETQDEHEDFPKWSVKKWRKMVRRALAEARGSK